MSGANVHPDLPASYDASDPVTVEKARLEQAKREHEKREVLASLLGTPAGRNWIWNLMADCKMFGTSFVPGQPDSTAYNDGRRSVAIQIWADLERVHPESLIQMMKEGGKA